ncbi:MAG: Uncharacterized protein XD63_0792 [Thermoanaerobacterales bacterium 50_218]|nr:MAG: Uncharacterized protein XD63_0792 [Thermoanaerobacterales bacterium 50_218]HAA89999.1 hypothetical protein [Peptococcaceae bacterium]
MEKRILEFCRLLRKYGLVVSFSQVIDALKAVAEVGFDPDDFYHALRAILVVEQEDLPLFNNLFKLYFQQPMSKYKKPKDTKATDSDDAGETEGGKGIEMAESADGAGMGTEGERLPPGSPAQLLVKAVREGNYPLLRALADMGVRNLGKLEPDDFKRLDALIEQAKRSIGWDEALEILFPARGF